MKAPKALVIAGEARLRSSLRIGLERGGYQVEEAAAGKAGVNDVAVKMPDIVILDFDLPDLGGVEVLRRVREWSRVPVLAIRSRDTVAEKVGALDAGADDCMIRPCDIIEMLARLRAIRRRVERGPDEPRLKCGALRMDLIVRLVTVSGVEVHLTPIEYGLLRLLAVEGGKVITQRQLLREIWGTESEAQSRHLRVHLSNMRRKLSEAGFDTRSLRNEPGIGYRLVSPD